MERVLILFIVRIVYIILAIFKSVGDFVSADFFIGFYIHYYINDISVIHCRSPPVGTNF